MILVVAGTRPELLKWAEPVKLARQRGLPIQVYCTKQSPDLVDKAMLEWDFSTDLAGAEAWTKAERLAKRGKAFVAVVGDTATVFRTAVHAFERGIPVFYLESGVRTYDMASPFPEEGYRRCVAQLARWHACTTGHNFANLMRNGLGLITLSPSPHHSVRVTGSPIVESVRNRMYRGVSERLPLVTLHRRENRGHFGDILRGMRDAVGDTFRWFGHPNGWAAQEAPEGIVPLAPQPPSMFAQDLLFASVVITDSGGVQEECNALGVPCVVARTVTDRPESLGPKGGAILGGNTRESITAAIQEALKLDRSQIDPTIFGDGKASERIVDWFEEILSTDA